MALLKKKKAKQRHTRRVNAKKRCVCIIPGCGKLYHGSGFCSTHYFKYKKVGHLTVKNIYGQSFFNEHKLTYNTWRGIKDRCYNPNMVNSTWYSEAGVTMDIDWFSSFKAFLRDMGDRPGKDYELDRIDETKGYTKDNCQWLTKVENIAKMFERKKLEKELNKEEDPF